MNRNGTQRYRCRRCKRYSTAINKRKKPYGEFQARAIRLYLDGMSLRAVARLLGVHHQTVGRWVALYWSQFPGQVVKIKETILREVKKGEGHA
jgi:transposase-like protein